MLKGKKVELRAIEKSDAPAYYKIRNDHEAQAFMSPLGRLPMSMAAIEKRIEEEEAANAKGKSRNFAVTLKGKFIGVCGYADYHAQNGTCLIFIMLGPAHCGKGLGTDALSVLLDLLFIELNMRKVQLGVFAENKRAITCYKKLGFVEEGLFKEQFYRDGKYHDDLEMALFKKDYQRHLK